MRNDRPLSSRWRLALPVATLVGPGAGSLASIRFSSTGDRAVAYRQSTPDLATPIPGAGWAEMIESMWAAVGAQFHIAEFGLYREHVPVQGEDKAFSYLWPYSGVVSAANARAARALAGTAGSAGDDLRTVLANLEQYWDERAEPPGYDSYVVEYGGGDKFYDDNEWLGIDFVLAYRLLGDRAWLDKAQAMWTFAISGWSDEMGGGIYWKEHDLSTKNTCSNAPAAVLALMLHEETGDAEFLDWAVRILDWTKQLKDPATGVYLDHVRDDGSIDPAKYSYNTGTPIHANALLYRATGDAAYLDEARSLARASLDWFAPESTATERTGGVRVFPDTPWFNSILMRGYVALREVDPDANATYVRAMLDFLELGWSRARDTEGLLAPDWSGLGAPDAPKWLLDQTPVIEIAAAGLAAHAAAGAAARLDRERAPAMPPGDGSG